MGTRHQEHMLAWQKQKIDITSREGLAAQNKLPLECIDL